MAGSASPAAEDTVAPGWQRDLLIVMMAILALTLALLALTSRHALSATRAAQAHALQLHASTLARSVDVSFETYVAALSTVSDMRALRVSLDLDVLAQDAAAIAARFSGWIMLAQPGAMMVPLMDSRAIGAPLPPPVPRSALPELARAEDAALVQGQPMVTDAFAGPLAGELTVAVVRPVTTAAGQTLFLHLGLPLRDTITWLDTADLDPGAEAVLADGSDRMITPAPDGAGAALTPLPDWALALVRGQDRGSLIVPAGPDHGARIHAFQRLHAAPRWIVMVWAPLPSPGALLLGTAWPVLAALLVLIVSGGSAALVQDRRRAGAESARTRTAAQERERLLVELRDADARKSRLMAVLSHDLRTPLVSLLGTLDLLEDRQDSESRVQLIQRARAGGYDMLQLIEDVLELARIGAGELRLRPAPFDPLILLDEVAEMIGPQAARRQTTLQVELHDMPPYLMGDRGALRRVLLNFATNAVKATQGGRILLSAQADPPDQAGYRVTLAVTDTGIGIADSDIPRLFQDFGMLGRNGGLAEEGTGLGLAICRRLADAMGGTVGVTSAPDQGSRFWLALTLPAAQAPAAPVPDNAGSTAILRGLRVLVADDHDTIRSLVCRGLRDSGAITTEAADGKAAVDLAQAQPFDLILMDLRMPLLDGSEAALRIRRGGGPSAGAQIIGLTARQTPATAIEYRNIAFDGWLGKPLELQKLVALLYQAAPQPENLPEMTDAFDDEKLRQLQAVDGGLLLAGALESLTEEIIEARDQIALLLAKGDGLAASRLAHKLAGACDFLGARALSARLRSFEAMARQDDNLPRLLAELPHLVAALDLARDQIARLIAGARGPLRSVPSAPG